MKDILTSWGLEDAPLTPVTDSVWQVGDRFMLKKYASRERAQRVAAVQSALAAAGLPTGGARLGFDGLDSWVLTEKLPGAPVRPDKAHLLGAVLAKLQAAMAACPELPEGDLLREVTFWGDRFFKKEGWRLLPEAEFRAFLRDFGALYPALPRGPIHRDPHPGNILFEGDAWSGILDFDLCQVNVRLFDPCYYLTGLLSRGMAPEDWSPVRAALLRSYDGESPLTEAEKAAAPLVCAAIQLIFAAWHIKNGFPKAAARAIGLFRFHRS